MHIGTAEPRLFIRICGLGEGASSAEMHISTSETRQFICIKGLGGGSSRAKIHIRTRETRRFICTYGLGEGAARAKLHISTSETRHLICAKMWCYDFVARSPSRITGSKEKAPGHFAGVAPKDPPVAHMTLSRRAPTPPHTRNTPHNCALKQRLDAALRAKTTTFYRNSIKYY